MAQLRISSYCEHSYCKEQSYQSYHLVFHNYYTSASAVFIETEICSRTPLISIIYVLQQKSIYMKFVYLKEILPIVWSNEFWIQLNCIEYAFNLKINNRIHLSKCTLLLCEWKIIRSTHLATHYILIILIKDLRQKFYKQINLECKGPLILDRSKLAAKAETPRILLLNNNRESGRDRYVTYADTIAGNDIPVVSVTGIIVAVGSTNRSGATSCNDIRG